ncbi:MAG: lipoprotein insertase outer membrane protein LolB [Steroidobacteraceae bacterium]
MAVLAALALATLLAGCVSAPRSSSNAMPWQQSHAALQQQASYQWSGRVAVAAGSEGFSSGIGWQQQQADTHLTLSGPLGVAAQLDYVGGELRYADRDGRKLTGSEAEQALAGMLGFELPLAQLRYWMLGVDDPSQPAEIRLDEAQRLASLTQSGWQIDYPAWRAEGGRWLPERVVLSRAQLRVKVLISQWTL